MTGTSPLAGCVAPPLESSVDGVDHCLELGDFFGSRAPGCRPPFRAPVRGPRATARGDRSRNPSRLCGSSLDRRANLKCRPAVSVVVEVDERSQQQVLGLEYRAAHRE